MRIQTKFQRLETVDSVAPHRQDYLDGLPEAQALLIEVQLGSAQAFAIEGRTGRCGYLLIDPDHTVLEFHLDRDHWVFGEEILGQAIRELKLQRALVKSFDSLLLSSALAHQCALSVVGLLVRDYVPRPLPELKDITFCQRLATMDDLPAIMTVDQQVFSQPERLRAVIADSELYLFEDRGRTLGFGMLRTIIAGRRDVDVGIAVDRPYRRRGHAVYMLRALVEDCLRRGLRPAAGCAVDNHASRHMGERIGFVSRHRLLGLTFS